MDTDIKDILIALIITIPGTIAAIVSLINSVQLKRVEKNTNSITERMGDAKYEAGKAAGEKEEQKRVEDIQSQKTEKK